MNRRITLITIASLAWMIFAVPSFAEEAAPDGSEAPDTSEPEIPKDTIVGKGLSIDERAYLLLPQKSREALDAGAYSEREVTTTAVLSSVVGFGTGHIVQKRWKKLGWVFTLGESLAVGLTLGLPQVCNHNGRRGTQEGNCKQAIYFGGAALFGGFRIGEIVETSVYSGIRNRNVTRARLMMEQTKQRLQYEEEQKREDGEEEGMVDDLSFHVYPNEDGGATFSLGLRF